MYKQRFIKLIEHYNKRVLRPGPYFTLHSHASFFFYLNEKLIVFDINFKAVVFVHLKRNITKSLLHSKVKGRLRGALIDTQSIKKTS